MPGPESLQIRQHLLARRTALDAPVSLAEQRAAYDLLPENYVGHAVPLPEGVQVEPVDVDGIAAEWLCSPGADSSRETDSGPIMALTIWESQEAFEAARPAMIEALRSIPLDEWEARPREFHMLNSLW